MEVQGDVSVSVWLGVWPSPVYAEVSDSEGRLAILSRPSSVMAGEALASEVQERGESSAAGG